MEIKLGLLLQIKSTMSERTDITRGKTAIKFISKPRFRMNTDSFVKYWRENGGGTYGKVSYNCFYDRVKHGRDWKEAMQKQNRKYQTNVYKPQPQKQTEKRTDYTGVDITYSQEEAKVFKNMFENIINDLEKKYEKAEEPHEANKIFEKIEFVKRDYQIFLHHNS